MLTNYFLEAVIAPSIDAKGNYISEEKKLKVFSHKFSENTSHDLDIRRKWIISRSRADSSDLEKSFDPIKI